jgi:F-type H+-transporting ATPase subunit delta
VARRAYSKRYAQAAFEIALEAGELERWQSDLQKVVRAVSDQEFTAALENPKVHFSEKSKLLSGQIKELNPLLLNLLLILINKSRLGMVGEIEEEYRRLVNGHHGMEIAEVTTAVPLSKEEEEKLAGRLGQMVGKKVEIRAQVDPGLIGGFVARIGGRLLDGSVRSRLAALKKEMAGAER